MGDIQTVSGKKIDNGVFIPRKIISIIEVKFLFILKAIKLAQS